MAEVKQPVLVTFPTPDEIARTHVEKSANILRQAVLAVLSQYNGEQIKVNISSYKRSVRDLVMGELQGRGWKVTPGVSVTHYPRDSAREDIWFVEENRPAVKP